MSADLLRSRRPLLVLALSCAATLFSFSESLGQTGITSLRGLPPAERADAAKHQDSPVAPSDRYKVSVSLDDVTHDLGAVDAPASMSTTPLQVGVTRNAQIASSARAERIQNADGTTLLIFAIKSPGAASMRLQFSEFELWPGDEVYVRSADAKARVAGPYRADGKQKEERFWSATIEGETAVVEYHIRSKEGRFVVASVAHVFNDMTAEPPDVLGCHRDASCSSGPNDAVARIKYISGGGVYLCTATLLNNYSGDRTPYLYTARHCVNTQAAAASVEAYWLYQTSSCDSGVLRDWSQTSGGADLLATGSDSDSALLQLRDAAPSTAAFAGWSATVPPANVSAFGLHHPGGSLPPSLESALRRSDGTIRHGLDYCLDSGVTGGYRVDWNAGVIEPGSSGSGLFISDGAGDYVVGVLSCGPMQPSCVGNNATYGNFSKFFPSVRQYLEAPTLPAPTATAATFAAATAFTANWTAVTGATEYRLDVSTTSDFSSYLTGYRHRSVSNFLSAPVQGIAPDTTYYYRVRAHTNNSRSAYSNTIAVRVIGVTFQTNPAGVPVEVDGVNQTTPRTLYWFAGSAHTIAAPPQSTGAGSRLAWTSWSDGGAMSHTVAPSGSTTYTADYVRQHELTMVAVPEGTVNPGNGWYNVGTVVPISATPVNGESFISWTGSGNGSYTGGDNPAVVTMNGPVSQTARFTGGIQVRVQANIPNGVFMVDGGYYNTPQTFSWVPGSTHLIHTPSPQAVAQGTQYAWRSWSDGGPSTHYVAPTVDTTYTAEFALQHQLLINRPINSNLLVTTPQSGWFDYGVTVPISATWPGHFVYRWSGFGTGSYSGTNNPATVTMLGPITQGLDMRPTVKPDFNSNGNSEILWQNNITGQRAVWWMSGSTWVGEHFLPTVGAEWQIATTGDFNSDGHHDIVWQNNATGQRAIWLMNGSQWIGERWLPTIPVAWQIAASGDFNGDAKPDLVWQNTATGQRAIWFMNDGNRTGEHFLPTVPPEWEIVAAAKFDGNLWPDLLWQNNRTGQRAIWLMFAASYQSERFLPYVATEWKIAGTGDYNADTLTDIVWQNTATGVRAIWLMNYTTYNDERFLPTVGLEWSIKNH